MKPLVPDRKSDSPGPSGQLHGAGGATKSGHGFNKLTRLPPHARGPATMTLLVLLALGAGVTTLGAQTNCLPSPSGLVAWWSGDGHTFDLVSRSAGSLVNGASFTTGQVAQGLSFDGQDDQFLPGEPTPCPTNDFTLTLWVWPTADRRETSESVTGNSGTYGHRFAIFPKHGGSGASQAGIGLSIGMNGISVVEHADNHFPTPLVHPASFTRWVHVALVYSDRQPSLFVDGVQVRTGLRSERPFVFCSHRVNESPGYGAFAGLLDEIAIWDRALTAQEIAAIYEAGNAGMCKSCPERILRVANRTEVAGRELTVPVSLLGRGNENAVSFSLRFDPARLGYHGETLGVGAGGAMLMANTNRLSSGLLGYALAKPVGQFFPAGSNELVRVRFQLAGTPAATTVAFTNWPVALEVVDETASVLCADTENGTLTITPLFLPGIEMQPQGRTVQPIAGIVTNVALSVTATGSPPLFYQWRLTGVSIVGATGSSLLLSNVSVANSGGYDVVVSNAGGAVTSQVASVTVLPTAVPPTILAPPQNWIASAGETVLFSVGASGTTPLLYQWYFNGSPLPDETNQWLVLADVTNVQGGNYSVVVANLGGSAASPTANLTVSAEPRRLRIVEQSAATSAEVDVPIELRALGDENALGFSLAFDGSRLRFAGAAVGSGAAGASLLVNTNELPVGGVGMALVRGMGERFSAGTSPVVLVRFRARDVSGPTPLVFTNRPIALEVADVWGMPRPLVSQDGLVNILSTAPAIVTQPEPMTNLIFTTAHFAVTASGSQPLSYQWQLNGVTLPGQTSSTLTLADLRPGQAGEYRAIVSNAVATVTSSVARLAVSRVIRAAMTNAPTGNLVDVPLQLLAAGDENAAGFSLHFDPARLSYREVVAGSWPSGTTVNVNRNQAAAGALGVIAALDFGSSFTLGTQQLAVLRFVVGNAAGDSPLTFSDAPVFRELVDNSAWPLLTEYQPGGVAALLVAPLVTVQPAAQTVLQGTPVSFSVAARGSLPMTYQWQRNGINLPGQTTESLSLPNVLLSDAGAYSCRIENAGGVASSTTAILTVFPPPADLFLTQLTAPVEIVAGEPVTLWWTVTNAGTQTAYGPWQDAVFVAETPQGEGVHPLGSYLFLAPLATNQWLNHTGVVILPPGLTGTRYFGVMVDSGYQVPESNETNNTFVALTASEVRAADLSVDLLASASTGQFGTTIPVTWGVTNVGGASASGAWSDRLYLSASSNSLAGATVLATMAGVRPLAPGAGYSRTVLATLPSGAGLQAGTWFLVAVTDFDEAQTELGEANNTAVAAIQLTQPPRPDLAVAHVLAPSSVTPGQPFSLAWALTNRGPIAATGLWTDAVLWSNAVSGVQELARFDFTNGLTAGGFAWRTQSVTLPITGPAGAVWLGAQADALREVTEEDESNNLALAPNVTTVPLILSLQLPLAQIAEDAANPFFDCTVTRNGSLTALTVHLSSSDTNEVTVPPTVLIPAGQHSATFQARVMRDFRVDGAKAVALGGSASGFVPASQSLTVLDVDLPRLTLTLMTNAVWEGENVSASVARDVVTAHPVTVVLQSSSPGQLSPPTFVTIPGGAASTNFTVLAVDDNLVEGIVEYTVSASAAGFDGAAANVFVLDNDLPGVSVSLASATVSEGAGPQATTATVTRSILSARSLAVSLESTNMAAALVPARVVIPGNQYSVSFPVAAVNGDQVSGAKTTLIRPFVLASGSTTRLLEGVGALLAVTDDDGPTLKVVATKKLVAEGQSPATTLTVLRNTPATNALPITLASSDLTEATVPANAVIPAGTNAVVVSLISLSDGATDGNQSVVITANSPGYVAGNETVVVSDTDLPDLVVSSVNAPATSDTDTYIGIGYRVSNQGLGPAGTNFLVRVYLAKDPFGDDKVLAAQAPFEGTIPVGLFFEQNLQVRTPLAVGNYWVVVEVDAGQQVAEVLEENNTTIALTPIAVRAAYGAWVQTPLTTALANTPVPMSGRATNAAGTGASTRLVNLHILARGTERVISALTDSLGNFATTWQPLPGEAGYYQIFATHPGVGSAPVQDEFRLVGMRADPPSTAFTVVEGASYAGSATIENLSDLALTGLGVSVVSAPSGLTVTASLAGGNTLAGGAKSALNYTVSPATALAYGYAVLRVTSAEGASVDVTLAVSVEPLRPRLVATPGSLAAGMARGRQTVVEFTLANEGGIPTGPITIALPAAPWLSLATTNPLPPLAPGESNAMSITLLLTPAADLTLGAYEGSLALNSSNASLTVPFNFRALSEAKGDLRITAVDELTYYAVGSPNLAGASVTVRDAVARTNVATGVTDASGQFLLNQLPEGYYELELTADKHTTYKQTHLLLAGRTNDITAFLSRQVVTYTWTVQPIEIEDRYQITIETTFETTVPVPVVTIEPAVIDLAQITTAETQIMISITNHGLIAANNTRLDFPTHPLWEFTPLLTQIGTLPARSGVTIPLIIRKLAPPGGRVVKDDDLGPCYTSAYVCWDLVCGPLTNTYCGTVAFPNARSGCGSTPPSAGPGGPGGGWGGGWGGGGGTYINSPTYSYPSLCDCESLDGLCFGGEKSFDLDGIAQKVIGVLGKLIPPPLQLDDVNVSVSVGGQLCTCCDNGHLGLSGSANGSAQVEVVVILGRGASLPDMAFSAPGWADLSISGSAMAGLRLTATGTLEARYDKQCLGEQHLCGSGSLTLNLFGGVDIEGQASAKLLADQLTYEGTVSGQLGLEGEVSVTLEGCSDTGFKVTGCGEATARAHFTGELVTTTPQGPKTNTIGPNGDVVLLKRTCLSGRPSSPGGRQPKDGDPPLVEEYAGGEFFYPIPTLFSQVGIGEAQSGGVCARVKLRTEQEAVITRDAFRATLEINNQDVSRLENIAVALTISDASGVDRTSLFGIRTPELLGLSAVDGTGILAGASTGTARWVLIPTSDAAPTNTTQYFVSGRFRYTQGGTELSVPLAPVSITVLPTPKLYVHYFHERDVFSDDPFTDVVEPAIPFNLAVMIQNKGFGTARNFRITSAQPQIVENEKGLLVDFQIIATEVAGQNMVPSLTADFGNLNAGQIAIGRWLMTSTLQGLFTDYKATFQHLDALEGVKLSLLEEVNIHELIHLVQAGGAFEDGKPDFLVNDIPDLNDRPDTLWLSDGRTNPVQVVEVAVHDGPPTPARLQIQISAAMPGGWAYLRVPEPSDGAYQLTGVRRSDGASLALDKNVWVTDRTFIGMGRRPIRENILHLLDYNSTGLYTLTYELGPAGDTSAPWSQVTALPGDSYRRIPVSWSGADETGGSGVSGYDIFVSENGGSFTRWLERTPLTGSVYFGTLGSSYSFYSVAIDQAGNREAAPGTPDATTTVTLTNRPPVLAPVSDLAVDEGTEFELPLSASDLDTTDALTFSLVSSPSGMSINPGTGLIHWLTSEGTGPSTNAVIARVQDNGDPPLSATTAFNLLVREVNSAPVLGVITNRTINEGQWLVITNVASDNDLPPNRLTFSLRSPYPSGVTLNATNGILTWRPTETQGPATNSLAVIVADDGSPSLSRTQEFTITVRDTLSDFSLSLGRTNLLAGESGSLPMVLRSSLDLTDISLWLTMSPPQLTNLSLRGLGGEVLGASLISTNPSFARLNLTLDPNQAPASLRTVAMLEFQSLAEYHSAVIALDADSLLARRADGAWVTNGAAGDGRVILVGREPVMESVWNGGPWLLLYGRPGAGYALEYRTNSVGDGPWQEWQRFTLTNRIAIAPDPLVPGFSSFWRALEFRAAPPN